MADGSRLAPRGALMSVPIRRGGSEAREERLVVGRVRAFFEPTIDALPNIGIVLLLLIGSWLVSEGNATPGDLVLAAVVFGLLSTPLRVFGFFLQEMPRSVVALERQLAGLQWWKPR